MSEKLRDKIKSEILEASWGVLKEHAERGGLLFVDQELVLEEVALSVALDDTASVKAWMDRKLLSRPNEKFLINMETLEHKIYRFVIVQPFVLFQELSH